MVRHRVIQSFPICQSRPGSARMVSNAQINMRTFHKLRGYSHRGALGNSRSLRHFSIRNTIESNGNGWNAEHSQPHPATIARLRRRCRSKMRCCHTLPHNCLHFRFGVDGPTCRSQRAQRRRHRIEPRIERNGTSTLTENNFHK